MLASDWLIRRVLYYFGSWQKVGWVASTGGNMHKRKQSVVPGLQPTFKNQFNLTTINQVSPRIY